MRKLDHGILITFATRLVVIASGIGTSIMISRMLGPAGRGEFFVAMTLSATLTQFLNLGLHSTNTYLVADNRSLLAGLLGNSIWLSLALGGLGSLIVGAALRYSTSYGQMPALLLWTGLALAPPTLVSMFANSLLLGIGRVTTYNLLQMAQAILLPIAVGGCYFAGGGAVGVIQVTLGVNVAIAAATWWLATRAGGCSLWFQWPLFRRCAGYAWRAYVVCLLGFLLMRANVYFLKQWCDLEEVGFFSIGSQIADYLWLLPTTVATVLFPELVRDRTSGWEQTKRMLVRMTWLLVATCLTCAALVTPFVRLAYGEAFLPAVPAVWCLLPGILCYGLTSVVSQYVAAAGIPRSAIGAWAVTVAVVGVLGPLCIPIWGARGAGIAFSLAAAANFAMLLTIAWTRARAEAGWRSAGIVSTASCPVRS